MKAYFYITLLIVCLNSCKKSNPVKPASSPGTIKAATLMDSISGKWYINKDSVRTLDLTTPIPNLVTPPPFGPNDNIIFNRDSTAIISSNAAFSAFYTDYRASNTDSQLIINTAIRPNLKFKFNVSRAGYGARETRYALTAQNLAGSVSISYEVRMPSAATMVLTRTLEIPTTRHDYRIMEFVYLRK